jgi:hypothetical protein
MNEDLKIIPNLADYTLFYYDDFQNNTDEYFVKFDYNYLNDDKVTINENNIDILVIIDNDCYIVGDWKDSLDLKPKQKLKRKLIKEEKEIIEYKKYIFNNLYISDFEVTIKIHNSSYFSVYQYGDIIAEWKRKEENYFTNSIEANQIDISYNGELLVFCDYWEDADQREYGDITLFNLKPLLRNNRLIFLYFLYNSSFISNDLNINTNYNKIEAKLFQKAISNDVGLTIGNNYKLIASFM